MTADTEAIISTLSRLEEKLDNIGKVILDHEERIRDLEKDYRVLFGKLTALMVICMTAAGLIAAWMS